MKKCPVISREMLADFLDVLISRECVSREAKISNFFREFQLKLLKVTCSADGIFRPGEKPMIDIPDLWTGGLRERKIWTEYLKGS